MARNLAITAVGLFTAATASAGVVDVTGGQTSVLLDTATLEAAASLELSSVSAEVIAPGALGPDSVAFPINSRSASSLPTTFSYDPDNFLTTFSGTIEHTGVVRFNADSVEVGNFTIGYDAARAGTLGGAASGFFVQSTAGVAAILFDIENPTTLEATDSNLNIAANLLVSPEFGQFLFDNAFSSSNLAGADVGDALVNAIPAPGTLAVAGLGALALARRRRG
ncbi:MAG: PEP-CTERM sorting domain-containing protein [Planctomycetota bacterium]|nr:PEP-CTERM sorting domain-containing protein [Planctomycetota bacterium]